MSFNQWNGIRYQQLTYTNRDSKPALINYSDCRFRWKILVSCQRWCSFHPDCVDVALAIATLYWVSFENFHPVQNWHESMPIAVELISNAHNQHWECFQNEINRIWKCKSRIVSFSLRFLALSHNRKWILRMTHAVPRLIERRQTTRSRWDERSDIRTGTCTTRQTHTFDFISSRRRRRRPKCVTRGPAQNGVFTLFAVFVSFIFLQTLKNSYISATITDLSECRSENHRRRLTSFLFFSVRCCVCGVSFFTHFSLSLDSTLFSACLFCASQSKHMYASACASSAMRSVTRCARSTEHDSIIRRYTTSVCRRHTVLHSTCRDARRLADIFSWCFCCCWCWKCFSRNDKI